MPFRKLVHGFKLFQSRYFLEKNKLYRNLVQKGQSPEVLVIACSDSRNDPALITQSEPGDMFVVRNVAALVPPYQPDGTYHGTSSAIEFAVKGLKVKDIVVMGHALCGGVHALLSEMTPNNETENFEFLTHWVKIGKNARDSVIKELADYPVETQQRALEQAIILTSLHNLMTFPWIRDSVMTGKITLHGWYFDMISGKMLGLDFTTGCFKDISETSLALAFSKRSTHYCDCKFEDVTNSLKTKTNKA